MWYLTFIGPKCQKIFGIRGYWNWVLRHPFHWFGKRHMRCPECGEKSWIDWKIISKF